MAKVIWAVTALAFVALVSGFFVDTSTLPLIVSIALSAVVMLAILLGWSKRIRQGIDLLDDEAADDAIEELDVVEADPEVFKPPPAARRTGRIRDEVADLTAVIDKPVGGPRAPRAKPGKKPAPKKAPVKKPVKPKKPATTSKSRAKPKKVVVIPGRSRFHAPGCRFARGDEARRVSEATARRRGYAPCTVCAP